ncbi:MAG: hypothetical protein NZ480_04570 [Bdellovibrionaceae bacterium]|nr:hypothetical protein [Pseudobdellovibrionaceae bacterium]MDW8190443.1 hypothetical protein [Pseudobdellovibrionaceae bacterium]
MTLLKAFLIAIGIVLLLKWRINDRSIEDHAYAWIQSPSVQSSLEWVSEKTLAIGRKISEGTQSFLHRNFCEASQKQHKE